MQHLSQFWRILKTSEHNSKTDRENTLIIKLVYSSFIRGYILKLLGPYLIKSPSSGQFGTYTPLILSM